MRGSGAGYPHLCKGHDLGVCEQEGLQASNLAACPQLPASVHSTTDLRPFPRSLGWTTQDFTSGSLLGLTYINPEYSLEGHAEAEAPILWPPHSKSWLIGKDLDAGKDWGQEKGATEDEMFGWHHWLDGHESGQTPGDGEGQGGLAGCSPWGRRVMDWDMTEQLNDNLYKSTGRQSPQSQSPQASLSPACLLRNPHPHC